MNAIQMHITKLDQPFVNINKAVRSLNYLHLPRRSCDICGPLVDLREQ